ncbi:MAG: hypothetical protein V9F03_07280 [Microthrixaceae bacterium]
MRDRIITTLAGTDLTSGSLRVGDALPIDSASDAVVESPSGARTRVRAGELPPELDRTGIWTITSGGKGQNTNTRLAVANPSPSETQITPRKGLAIPGVEAARNDAGAPSAVVADGWGSGGCLCAGGDRVVGERSAAWCRPEVNGVGRRACGSPCSRCWCWPWSSLVSVCRVRRCRQCSSSTPPTRWRVDATGR